MLSIISEKDIFCRILVRRDEIFRVLLKAVFVNEELNYNVRQLCMLELSRLPKNSSKVRVKNRCLLSGRSRSISRKFKLSRIKFKELALNGELPGVIKASW